MDKNLYVLAGYDPESEKKLSAMQENLYRHGFCGTHTRGIPQHITMGSFPTAQETELLARVRNVAQAAQAFDISFSHVGVFPGGRVLFAAPDCNRPLLALRESFEAADGWTPHNTLLIDEPNTILDALGHTIGEFEPFRARITALHLYEFWPTRYLMTCPLQG